MKIKTAGQLEPLLFYSCILLHTLPVFSVHYFLTVDGPAHLYNANLIRNFLTGEENFLNRYFYFNPNPEPNWSGHLLMSLLLSLFPSFIAERMLLLSYIISLPLAFRLFVTGIYPDGKWWSYLIFPFVYNIAFCFGFFNFSLGLPVLFFTLHYWNTISVFNFRKFVFLVLLVMLGYFSHLMIGLLILALLGILLAQEIYGFSGNLMARWKKFRPAVMAFLGILIPLTGLVLYFFRSKGLEGYKGTMYRIPGAELWQYIFDTRSIICWIYDEEQQYALYLGLLFLLLTCLFTVSRMKGKPFRLLKPDIWMLVAVILLVLFFIIPDSAGSGGFISVRILLLFHLFLMAWIAFQQAPEWIRIGSAGVSLAVSTSLMAVHMRISNSLDKEVTEYLEILPHLESRSNLLPLNYSENWLHLNLSNYAGAAKNIVVMDNYEGHYPQFPLRWQETALPYGRVGDFASSRKPYVTLSGYEKESGIRIGYISRWMYQDQFNDSCTLLTNRLLLEQFDSVFTSSGGKARLYKRKSL